MNDLTKLPKAPPAPPATYEVTSPNGTVYVVEGPRGATEAEVIAQVQAATEQPSPDDTTTERRRLSPQDEQAYEALTLDPKSTAADIRTFALQRGFDIPLEAAQAFVAERQKQGAIIPGGVRYKLPAAPPVVPKAPNSTRENIRGALGSFVDGAVPGASGLARGLRGVVVNGAQSLAGDAEFAPGDAYSEYSADQKAVQAEFAEQNPNANAVAGWTGVGAGFALPASKVFKGGSIAAGMGNGALTGAAYGAATGALNDTGEGRVANAINGTVFGTTLGAVAAPAIRGAGAVGAAARRNIPGVDETLNYVAARVARLRGLPTPPPNAAAHAQAERMLAEQMDGSNRIATGMGTGGAPSTPDNIVAEVQRRQAMGVPAMPVDVAEDLRRTTAWALQARGPMASRARQALSERQASTGSRVRGHITEELGPTVDPIAEIEAIRRRSAAASGPGYAQAYAQPMVITPEIQSIMRTPAFREALPQALRNIRNAQRNPQELGFQMDAQGNIQGVDTLSTEGFDQVIRAMRDSGRAAMDSSGFTPRNTTNSVHINARAGDLRGEMAAQNPAYADVTANYADEMALQTAMTQGADVAKLSGPEIASQMRDMPQHANEAWLAGARTSLADRATTAGLKPTANVPQQVRQAMGFSGAGSHASLGDQQKLQAIEAMSGRPGVMNRLDDRLEGEDQAYQSYLEAARAGSPRGFDEASFAGSNALEVVKKAATGNFLGAASSLLQGIPRGTAGFREAGRDRIAEIMTASDPIDIERLLAAVQNRRPADLAANARRYGIANDWAKVGTNHAVGQNTGPLQDDPDDYDYENDY
jgi:hypothetical protein